MFSPLPPAALDTPSSIGGSGGVAGDGTGVVGAGEIGVGSVVTFLSERGGVRRCGGGGP